MGSHLNSLNFSFLLLLLFQKRGSHRQESATGKEGEFRIEVRPQRRRLRVVRSAPDAVRTLSFSRFTFHRVAVQIN